MTSFFKVAQKKEEILKYNTSKLKLYLVSIITLKLSD